METLSLETGLVDDGRKQLEPGHRRFDEFLWAWRHQDSWSLEEHQDYWRSHLGLWPRQGRPSSVGMYACAVRAGVARGASFEEIAEALGYSTDDLRRMVKRSPRRRHDCGAPTPEESARLGGAVTDYVLPRVYAYPHDAPPDRYAYPNYSQAMLDEFAHADPRYAQVAGDMSAILSRPIVGLEGE